MKLAFLSTAAATALYAASAIKLPHGMNALLEAFEEFKAQHGKLYATDVEELHRFNIFAASIERARAMNELDGAEYGITKFSDLTAEEFKSQYLTYRPQSPAEREETVRTVLVEEPAFNSTATSFDWRTKGAVTAVKDQGSVSSEIVF